MDKPTEGVSEDALTFAELGELIFLVRNRIRYESRRPSKYSRLDGHDYQAEKMWTLGDLLQKLERMKLAL